MIRNHIEAVVKQLVTAPSFLYGTVKELNALLDDASFPVVMLYNLQPIELKSTLSNAVDDKYSIYLEFLFKTEFDQYTSDNETYIEQAMSIAKEFLVKLDYYRENALAARYFKILKGEPAKSLPVYNKMDVNSTGVSLSLSLKTMNNEGYDPASRPL